MKPPNAALRRVSLSMEDSQRGNALPSAVLRLRRPYSAPRITSTAPRPSGGADPHCPPRQERHARANAFRRERHEQDGGDRHGAERDTQTQNYKFSNLKHHGHTSPILLLRPLSANIVPARRLFFRIGRIDADVGQAISAPNRPSKVPPTRAARITIPPRYLPTDAAIVSEMSMNPARFEAGTSE